MEVLGAVGSSIAVAQVLVAGRHVVNLVRGIPEIQKEYDSLRQEIKLIADFVGEAQRLAALSPAEANHSSRVQKSLLSRTAQQLKDIEDELAIVVAACGGESKDKSTQARKRKWLLREGKIDKLRDKARDAKTNLHNAILFHHQTAMSNIEQRQDEFESRIIHQLESFSIALSTQLAAVNPHTTKDLPPSPPTPASPTENIDDKHATPPPMQQSSLALRATSWETEHSVEYKTMVPMGRPGCSKSCRCRCHFVRQQCQSANWLQPLLGTQTVSPIKNVVVKFEYKIPVWFWTGMSVFKASYGSLTGLEYALRPVTGIRYGDKIWNMVRLSPKGVRVLICNEGRKYFPDDVGKYNGTGLLQYAMRYGMFETIEFLIDLWIDLLRKQGTPEEAMFQANDLLRWRRSKTTERELGILRRVVELAEDSERRPTKLCEAMLRGDGTQDIEQILLDEPWAIDLLDETGYPPLRLASKMARNDIVEMLISKGTDVNMPAYNNTSALMTAVSHDRLSSMSLLLTAKADLTIQNRKGQTALHMAVSWASVEAVQMLLSAGASTQTRDKMGQTPLHFLTRRERSQEELDEILRSLLVAKDTDIEAQDIKGCTPLWKSLKASNPKVLRGLIQSGASIHCITKDSRNILHCAAAQSRLETLRYLVGLNLSGIDHQLIDSWGLNPWERFQNILHEPDLELSFQGYRKPTHEEQRAFVELYQGIRDRNLQNDISRLQRVLEALSEDDRTAASALIILMCQEKTKWKNFKLASWYRGIEKEVQVGDLDVAIRMIDSDIACLEQEMSTPLWCPKLGYDACGLEEKDHETSELAGGTGYAEDGQDDDGNCTDADEGPMDDPIGAPYRLEVWTSGDATAPLPTSSFAYGSVLHRIRPRPDDEMNQSISAK
ncbi:hypothetical protein NM208_g8143 [Fusarium decemcellulare]|uniref:Uncharacterized protein n=1 Tax=Fusarium decemcellulare TaxID=57161 RepID=A0ACC1S6L8_9HYPO|nr:hypothetical protein NM208_g8143 [Fusarium decemcellulare]